MAIAKNPTLAILGGARAVSALAMERWQPPNDRIKALIGEMIDRGAYSVAGACIPKQFEQAFAAYIGAPYCFALDHGTSALWSAYFGVGISPGDEVLHPCYTWICSIAPAVHMGARPLVGDYAGYPEGSLPVSEEAHSRIIGMPVFAEESPGYSDQVIAAFKKVTSDYRLLF